MDSFNRFSSEQHQRYDERNKAEYNGLLVQISRVAQVGIAGAEGVLIVADLAIVTAGQCADFTVCVVAFVGSYVLRYRFHTVSDTAVAGLLDCRSLIAKVAFKRH